MGYYKPDCIYMLHVNGLNKSQCYYDYNNACIKATEIIYEMGYPLDKIYSRYDINCRTHFYVDGQFSVDENTGEKMAFEPLWIEQYTMKDYDY